MMEHQSREINLAVFASIRISSSLIPISREAFLITRAYEKLRSGSTIATLNFFGH